MSKMIEIVWGKPLNLVAHDGETKIITTIEQARYMLRKQWPDGLNDETRQTALQHIEYAMDCIGSVGLARRSFMTAATTAGYKAAPLTA